MRGVCWGQSAERVPSDEAEQLRAALLSDRRISIAMSILMRDRNFDEDQAFAA